MAVTAKVGWSDAYGFGKFSVKNKGRRRGRNPGTGQDLMLAERRVVTFKCSTVLKRKLNGGQY